MPISKSFIIFALSIFTMPVVGIHADQSTGNSSILNESAHWPPRVQLNEPVETLSGKRVPKGRECVLIRVDPGPDLIMDFGREGLARVAPAKTDFEERREAIASGEVKKTHPNWTMMLGRGFADAAEGGRKLTLRGLEPYENFLIIYLRDPEAAAAVLQEFIEKNKADLEASHTLPVIFPLDEPVSLGKYTQRLQEAELELVFMLPYLSRPYADSMGHDLPDTGNFAVWVDEEGRTLCHPESKTDFESALTEIARAMHSE